MEALSSGTVVGTGPYGSDQIVQSLGTPRPFGSADAPVPSPEDRFRVDKEFTPTVGPRLRNAAALFPSTRQRTQGEIINLTLALERLGNPFSVRRIPFSVLRDMLTDPMIGFAYYYTKIPLMRASWRINCQDPQIAQAVDEALRPVNARIQNQICGKLGYGYQPMCKRFKLGQLTSTYRDHRKADPNQDLPVWPSNTPALLWLEPQVLAPEHCMPRWNDAGEFDGFTYSLVPLPNPVQVGITELFGYQSIPGYTVPAEFAVWPVNERDENFGSIYGSPRTKRAYRYWWSYWYRWSLADRIFESSADPVKIVYYPTDVIEAIDPNDPDPTNPTALSLQAKALELGAQARQGATLAVPGDFMHDDSTGRVTAVRKWAIQYLENKADFAALDRTFTMLDGLKFRAMFLPEEAFVQPGQGQRSARNVATQLSELYQEAAELLADENDDEINKHFIPQFIEANFPERAGIPCTKESLGFGQQDSDMLKQILTLVGQVKGTVLPVDIRKMLDQMGIPLLSQQQQEANEAQIAKEAAAMAPAMAPPAKVGMQGQNSGVEQTEQGFSYFRMPDRYDLSTMVGDGFLASLPKIPAYGDPAIRSSMIKLRKLMLDRYQAQVDSFAEHLRQRTTLRLAQQTTEQSDQQQEKPQGLSPEAAAGVASTVVGTWLGLHAAHETADSIKDLLSTIALRAGQRELKAANLAQDSIDPVAISTWAARRSQFVIGSVDNTLKGEMTTFLTDELQKSADPDTVARAADERFSGTPRTHSDRVVLAEALPAYNYGQLSALHGAGVSQVQAHDASDGRDELTDAECKQRDGEVMTVSQALAEAGEEHPAGTLYFTALSTDGLEVMIVNTLPGAVASDMLASYDQDHERLMILDVATEEQRRGFVLAVGAALAMT